METIDLLLTAAWLSEYHTPSFEVSDLSKCDELNTIAAPLVVKVNGRSERLEDTLSIYAEAFNGQMPNLDLINVVNYVAVHKQGFYVRWRRLYRCFPLLG